MIEHPPGDRANQAAWLPLRNEIVVENHAIQAGLDAQPKGVSARKIVITLDS